MTVAKTEAAQDDRAQQEAAMNCLTHKEDNMTVAKTEAAQEDWAQEEAVG